MSSINPFMMSLLLIAAAHIQQFIITLHIWLHYAVANAFVHRVFCAQGLLSPPSHILLIHLTLDHSHYQFIIHPWRWTMAMAVQPCTIAVTIYQNNIYWQLT